MSNGRSVNLTPSLSEFVGWYNLGRKSDDGYPVLDSQPSVPEFDQAEMWDLYCEFRDWFDVLVTPTADGPFDPLEEPPFFVRSEPYDRTLEVDANYRYLSVEVLRRVQLEFLGSHPLWRVVLIGEVPSCSIVIYPAAIRFGDLPIDVAPEASLSELISRNEALRRERERPRREHIARIQRLLPDALHTIGDKPFTVCGVLDSYQGDFSRLTICLLIRGDDRDACTLQVPPGSERPFYWVGSPLGIDREGAILSDIDVPSAAPFCLTSWLPPADYRGSLIIVERDTGREHRFEVTDESIIRTTDDAT